MASSSGQQQAKGTKSKPRPMLQDKDWKAFSECGRPEFTAENGDGEENKLFSVVWIELQFKDGSDYVFLQRGGHVEHTALFKVVDAEGTRRHPLESMTIYSNRSPCAKCAAELIEFLNDRPDMRLELIMTSLFHEDEEGDLQCCQGLELLQYLEPQVTLRVADTTVWKHLRKQCRNSHILVEHIEERLEREIWDELWSEQLSKIVKHVESQSDGVPKLLPSHYLISEHKQRMKHRC